ncbi:hypothetical protein [Actinoplanes sp. ATCC 53533]|uniref:hypothetical protein n=1 Tax=Actinoplanes sp. ATCC 53533 TaxID=1288362 RepID=UPI000F7B982E|nr:hypothetical protein [Actinoplanes sp. ATCC 53533]
MGSTCVAVVTSRPLSRASASPWASSGPAVRVVRAGGVLPSAMCRARTVRSAPTTTIWWAPGRRSPVSRDIVGAREAVGWVAAAVARWCIVSAYRWKVVSRAPRTLAVRSASAAVLASRAARARAPAVAAPVPSPRVRTVAARATPRRLGEPITFRMFTQPLSTPAPGD